MTILNTCLSNNSFLRISLKVVLYMYVLVLYLCFYFYTNLWLYTRQVVSHSLRRHLHLLNQTLLRHLHHWCIIYTWWGKFCGITNKTKSTSAASFMASSQTQQHHFTLLSQIPWHHLHHMNQTLLHHLHTLVRLPGNIYKTKSVFAAMSKT